MGLRQTVLVRPGAASVLVATGTISAVTLATRTRGVSVGSLAASPRAIGDGRVWLLVSSALVADRPAVPSLAGFVLVGLVTLAVCGTRAYKLRVARVAGSGAYTLAVSKP
jgi:hypothetical protein